MKLSSELYGEDYFERGIQANISLYENYRWLPHLTIPMVKSLIRHTDMKPNSSILDVGCAKGYMVRAFTELGFDAWGIEISDYAISHADKTIRKKIIRAHRCHPWRFEQDQFDWVISKDTLEHLTLLYDPLRIDELAFVLSECHRVAPKGFHIIPMGKRLKYLCQDYEKDRTHILRQPMKWWIKEFNNSGFDLIKATHRVKGIKDKWYRIHKKGNGFFTVTRKNESTKN